MTPLSLAHLTVLDVAPPDLFDLAAEAGFQNVVTEMSTYPFDFGKEKGFQLKCGTLLIKDKIDELGAQEVSTRIFEERSTRSERRD